MVAAVAARLVLDPILGDLFPFATLFLAVPVVALAGRGQDGARRRPQQSGIDEHLVKPVDRSAPEKLLPDPGPGPGEAPG